MNRLLCATDLLPKSENAIDRAGMIAEKIDATLSLLHVVSPTASPRALEQSIRLATGIMKSRARPPLWRVGPMPNVLVRTGNPARLILDTMTTRETDLLIIGPHRKRGVIDVLEGTIAQKALSARTNPVLIVRREPAAEYRNLLLALDGSFESGAVIRTAESLLRNSDALVTVVHAWEPQYDGMYLSAAAGVAEVAPDFHYARHAATAALRDLLARESADATRYELVTAQGRPVPTIEHAIKVRRPDLLVVGTRGYGPIRRAMLGSVANHLLGVAECDVLVVPHGSVRETGVGNSRRERDAVTERHERPGVV